MVEEKVKGDNLYKSQGAVPWSKGKNYAEFHHRGLWGVLGPIMEMTQEKVGHAATKI